MRNIAAMILFISVIGSVILFFVSICNYLIAFKASGAHLMDAYINNPYVGYWINLLAIFIILAVICFLFLLFTRRKVVNDGMYVYENHAPRGNGNNAVVDEYVTVRIKKDELSRLQ